MAEPVPVDCGFCRKRFLLKPEQFNREVRCPHCKTVVRIPPPSEAAQELAAALREPAPAHRSSFGHRGPAGLRAGPGRRTAPGQRTGSGQQRRVMSAGRPATRNAIIAMLVIIGLIVIVVGVGLWAVFYGGGSRESGKPAARPWHESPSAGKSPGASTGQPSARGTPGGTVLSPAPSPTASPTEAAAPGTNPTPATPATPGAPAGPPAPEAASVTPVDIKVQRLLGGYRDGTITYAVGRVTNNTDSLLPVLKVAVPISDSSGNEVGEAVAVILNIPPKTAVPLVAEWVHAEGARGNRWDVRTQYSPPGIPRDLPALSAEEPLPWPDPNALSMAGKVKVRVTNHGFVPVQTIDAVAILIGEDGKIVGAAKNRLTEEIKPRKSVEINIHWDHCSKTLVQTAEVWVQPGM